MTALSAATGQASRRRQLAWLISLRAVVVTALLGSAILVQINTPGRLPVDPFFYVIGFVYALTAAYALGIRLAERHAWLVDLQLSVDVLVVAFIVYISGGTTSYFVSLLVLPIVAAGILTSGRAALAVAALASVAYAAVVLAQYLAPSWLASPQWLGPSTMPPPASVARFTVGLNVFGFLVVAWLTGYLAENLRRAGDHLEQASSEIAGLQAFSQHVIDSLTSGLMTIDGQGRILTFNRAAETITGHATDSVIGRHAAEVLQLPPAFAGTLELGFEGRPSRRVDLVYTRSDGRRIDLGVSAAPLITATGRSGFLFNFQDVTEQRRLEREDGLQQRLAAVGEMAAGIAHEIRNPLASMSGSIQILRQELPLSAEQAQLMDIVLRESERLNTIISNFLAYARPQRFATSRLDVRLVLTDTALLLKNSAECHEGHEIVVDVPPEEVWFEADEGQLRQIIWNLATNGLRAMPGGGRLRIAVAGDTTATAGADDWGDIALSVQDEGVGIPSAELDSILQPFRGSFAKGTGLGLAIVHRIVSDYRGEILVRSEVGKGTGVRIRLPGVLAPTPA